MGDTTACVVKRIAYAMVLSCVSFSAASAAPVTFTWNPSQAAPALSGTAFTADTVNATNYLRSVNQSNGSFVEQFILPVTGFDLNGTPVTAPGLNSSYALYFTIAASGQPGTSGIVFNSLNISLFADPGHSNGVPSATTAGLSFSSGTSGDFLLGSGQLVSAALSLDSAGIRHASFLTSFTAAPGEAGFFGGSAPAALLLSLTTPPAVFSVVPQPDGSSIQLVNGGSAQATFTPEPGSMALIGAGIVALGFKLHRNQKSRVAS